MDPNDWTMTWVNSFWTSHCSPWLLLRLASLGKMCIYAHMYRDMCIYIYVHICRQWNMFCCSGIAFHRLETLSCACVVCGVLRLLCALSEMSLDAWNIFCGAHCILRCLRLGAIRMWYKKFVAWVYDMFLCCLHAPNFCTFVFCLPQG